MMSQPVAPASVMGVTLRPFERVVHFNQPNFGPTKTTMLIFGILLAPLLVGLLILYKRSQIDRNNPRAIIATNQRAIIVEGTGVVTEFPLQDLADVVAIRHQSRMAADRRPKTDPGYWRLGTAIGVELKDRRGGTTEVRCGDRPDAIWAFGLLLARGIEGRSFDVFPPVAFPA